MLDAPVSGSVPGAVGGTLSIMVGGEEEVYNRCLPVFEKMGSRITHCGGNGMGQITKLANQIIGQGTMAAMCEGFVFAVKAGGDPDALLKAFTGGAANSWMVENLGPKVFEGDFAPRVHDRLGPEGPAAWSRRPPPSCRCPFHHAPGKPDVPGRPAGRLRPGGHTGLRQAPGGAGRGGGQGKEACEVP